MVAVGVEEVEAAASGEGEDFFVDGASGGFDGGEGGFEVAAVEDDAGSAGGDGFGCGEAAVEASVVEGDVVGAPVLEGPSEDCGVEGLDGGWVGAGEFDVVDSVVVARC